MYKLANWVLSSSMDEKKVENKIRKKNRIQEKVLRFVYNDRNSTLQELLTKGKSVTLLDRSIQISVTEMFKVKKTRPRECRYKFRNTSQSKSYCVLIIILRLWVTCPTEF